MKRQGARHVRRPGEAEVSNCALGLKELMTGLSTLNKILEHSLARGPLPVRQHGTCAAREGDNVPQHATSNGRRHSCTTSNLDRFW